MRQLQHSPFSELLPTLIHSWMARLGRDTNQDSDPVHGVLVPSYPLGGVEDGARICRTYPWTDDEDVLTAVARGRIVHLGMAGIPLTTRPDFVQIPIRDLPPMPVG